MFTSNPLDDLAVAHARGRQLHADAAAERLRGISGMRRAIAASLRRAADRLDYSSRRPAVSSWRGAAASAAMRAETGGTG